MSKTFEKWYYSRFSDNTDYNSHWTAKAAWEEQQLKIDRLENKLQVFENTGMIGASPAQFLERIAELQSEHEVHEDKINDLIERLKIYEGLEDIVDEAVEIIRTAGLGRSLDHPWNRWVAKHRRQK